MKLLMKEREWFDKMECCNKLKPLITKEELITQKAEYYRENFEYLSKKKTEYYKKNYDAIKQYRGEKIKCECGGNVSRRNIAQHHKSQKHISFISQN